MQRCKFKDIKRYNGDNHWVQKEKKGNRDKRREIYQSYLSEKIGEVYSLHLKDAFSRRNYKLYANTHTLQIT
jgi:hypothetical protein